MRKVSVTTKGGKMNKVFVLAIGLVLFASISAFALPLGIGGHYELRLGDIPDIAGTQVGGVENILSLDRSFAITDKIAVIPFITGSIVSEELANDEVLRTLQVGADVSFDKKFSIGAVAHRTFYSNDTDDTRGYIRLKADF